MPVSEKAKTTVEVDGRKIVLSNLDKVLWPDDGFTKGDLIKYYTDVYPYLAMHLRGRPLVVTRFPGGINGKSFYQKNAPEGTPDWVHLHPWYSSHSERYIDFILCNDLPTLVWLANQACIELHPWMSRVDKLQNPDFIVMDLDPSEGATFNDVCDVAEVVHDVLEHFKLQFHLKTSGATGLHIYLPVTPVYTYEELRELAHLIAQAVVKLIPSKATIVRSVKDRGTKVYVDYLQNIQGKTVCSPYSVRPRPGATVSTPIEWKALRYTDPLDFNINTVPKRLEKEGDLFASVINHTQKVDVPWQQLKKAF
ncbi:MAG: non-homologous end-joining DNA ligase [Ignavibacteriales bacterium]